MATGETIPNLGEKEVNFTADNGQEASITYQVANITKPLTSVGELCDSRKRVVFGATGGFIYSLDDGSVVPFTRRNGLYEINHWIRKKSPGNNDEVDF